MQEEVKRIPLKNLIADPNQPRKHFDEAHIADLAHSISQYDVIHPIMVRPIKSQNKGKYMIVVGECRFRAAGLAMMVDIPCTIRVLTDVEALEIQITENLQRENVNPMEEADAFQAIIKGGQYKAKELAARLGKRTEYVLQRTKLCDLIPAFQDLVYADKMLLSQANTICRFSADVQQTFFDSHVPKNWKEQPAGWKLREVYFGNTTHNLDEATFKTEDPELNKKMGPCGQCRFNSAVSQLPFDGKENQRICSNPGCYEIKTKNAFVQKVKEVANDDNIVFVAGYTYSEDAKVKIKDAEATGKPVLKDNEYQVLKAPEPPKLLPDFESYKTKNEWQDDTTEDGMLEDYKNELEQYEEEQQQYQEELKEYEEKKQFAKQAYVVAGYRNEGQMVEVYIPSGNTLGTPGAEEQIKLLQEKHKKTAQKAEIDFLQRQKASLVNDDTYMCKDTPPELLEWLSIFYNLYKNSGYKMRQEIEESFSGNDNKQSVAQIISHVLLTGETGRIFTFIRRMLVNELVDGNNFEYNNDGLQTSLLLIKSLCGRYRPKPFNQDLERYQEEQKVTKQKLNEKVAALRQIQIPVEE